MEFELVDISHRNFISSYLKKYPPIISELTFTNLYLWRKARPIYFAELSDSLFFFIDDKINTSKKILFGPPTGKGTIKSNISLIDNLISGAIRITDDITSEFKTIGFSIESDRDNEDYLYKVSDLSLLEGRKYSKKRNHIKNCLNEYNCTYENISSSLVNECLTLQDNWCNIKGCDINPGLYYENFAIQDAFKYYDTFALIGGAIRVNGVIQAFAIGERLNNDTAVCHFEKANNEINGINQLITHWFAKYSLNDFIYVNREQDLGNSGLRKAKLSYYPVQMINKFIAKI